MSTLWLHLRHGILKKQPSASATDSQWVPYTGTQAQAARTAVHPIHNRTKTVIGKLIVYYHRAAAYAPTKTACRPTGHQYRRPN